MDLQDIYYKPQTKHVDRRMFPSGSKYTCKGILQYAGAKKQIAEKGRMLSSFFVSHVNLKTTN